MGYTLKIGELIRPTRGAEDTLDDVAELERDDAPAFAGDDAPQTNVRRPSARVWEQTVDALGLRGLFTGPRGLLARIPGAAPLRAAHVKTVRAAVARYQAAHPRLVARFDAAPEAAFLARGLWLEYWMDWAVRTCRRPVLVNR